MKKIYIDCSAGVSGLALLGALVDTGVSQDFLLEEVRNCTISGYKLSFEKTPIGAFFATRAVLEITAGGWDVPVMEFLGEVLNNGAAHNNVKGGLSKVLMKYAAAGSKMSNIPTEEVRMDRSGLLRAAVVSACYFAALDQTGANMVVASPIPVCENNSGLPETPLVLELARGSMVCGGRQNSSTALGVALLTASADDYGSLPEMFVHTIGYGALGVTCSENTAVRIVSGEARESLNTAGKETVLVVETNIDNMSAEIFPYLIERLFAAGALDAFLTPIYMKKGRPAILLTVLCREEFLRSTTDTIFKETTTLGVRIREERRETLRRNFFKVSTPYGNITVKLGYLRQDGEPVQVAPEFEECKAAALEYSVPLKDVYAAAQQAAFTRINK